MRLLLAALNLHSGSHILGILLTPSCGASEERQREGAGHSTRRLRRLEIHNQPSGGNHTRCEGPSQELMKPPLSLSESLRPTVS